MSTTPDPAGRADGDRGDLGLSAERARRHDVPRRSRLLGRLHQWGDLENWSTRYGSSGYCLTIYPPGTTATEASRYWMLRHWPPIGFLLGLAVLLVATSSQPATIAIILGALVYTAGAIGLARLAGTGRKQIRTLSISCDMVSLERADRLRQQQLYRLAVTLLYSEKRLLRGEIDAVAFEAIWGAVWREIGESRPPRL